MGPTNLTPMLAQYLELKRQHADAILFYRMGDFYEMFFEDAVRAAPILEVQLTARDKNAADPIPMCGVPHHSAASYIQKLLNHGQKVALCEQMEDPSTTKGLVRREVVRILTPALIGDPDLVASDQTHYLMALHPQGDDQYAVCLLNLLDNRLRAGIADAGTVLEVAREYQPREVLTHRDTALRPELEIFFQANAPHLITYRDAYFCSDAEENPALSGLMRYLQETQKTVLPDGVQTLPLFSPSTLALDSVALHALEITRANSEEGIPLVGIIDRTVTPMGRRALRDWLREPSRDPSLLMERLDVVEALRDRLDLAEKTRSFLGLVRDLERLSTKTALGLALPRDLVAIRQALLCLPELQDRLAGTDAAALQNLGNRLKPLPELASHLARALEDAPPVGYRDGGIFRSEFHPSISEYRALSLDAKGTIAAMEDRERQRTGIPSLKIKFSKVFGYTIEITNSHLGRVPEDYIRKQTISTGERFITEELKTFEEKVISAEHRLKSLEESLFLELRQKVASFAADLSLNARVIAEIDTLQSFARVAREGNYCRPCFNSQGILEIEEGRHPVVESLLPPGRFVPNSITLCPVTQRTLLITGPNMGGKSTIMRQVALTCVLAQAGCFVPATRANLPLLDAIFTRIGSSDDLSRGRSTFMVEMTEVARILRTATPESLILIDEIGRGTSTYDGLALAWSLLEHVHNVVQAKTLFATHFHEITALEKSLPGLKNANVLVQNWKEEVVFLYKLAPGVCNRSYGIEVAKIAGLPAEVLKRARDIQGILETQSQRANRARSSALEMHSNQLGLFDGSGSPETLEPLES